MSDAACGFLADDGTICAAPAVGLAHHALCGWVPTCGGHGLELDRLEPAPGELIV